MRCRPPKRGFSWFYFLISFIYALLGGVVAVALPAVTMFAALYAGVTMPLLISAIGRHAVSLRDFNTANTARPAEPAPRKEQRSLGELIRTHANGLFSQDKQDM